LNRNKLYIYNRALTLLEVMIGLLIFTILFLAAASAFAPSGTTHHSLLRDSTQVMRLANYFLNDVEKKIAYSGDLDTGLLGEHGVRVVECSGTIEQIYCVEGNPLPIGAPICSVAVEGGGGRTCP